MSEATSGAGVSFVPGFRSAHPGYDAIAVIPHQRAGGWSEAIPIMFRTTAMGFAKGSTHPTICCLTGCLRCPTGKSVTCLSSPLCKNIPLRRTPKSNLYPSPSRPPEGRLAIVTDAGRDAMDAGGASDEGAGLRTAKSCGPDASTPASSLRNTHPQATVTRKPDRRGEHEGNR
jgi:hypothetical protein